MVFQADFPADSINDTAPPAPQRARNSFTGKRASNSSQRNSIKEVKEGKFKAAMGLPECLGSARNRTPVRATTPIRVKSPDLGSQASEESRRSKTPSSLPTVGAEGYTGGPGAGSAIAPFSPLTILEQGVTDVEECRAWVQPRKMDGGFLSTLARLTVEVGSVSQEWHCDRRSQEIAEAVPLDPYHTAQASSLLLRVVRSLPMRLPLKGMLELLVQELLRAIYRHWPWVPTLDDLSDEEVSEACIAQFTPFYTLLWGHQGLTEKAEAIAKTATAEAKEQSERAAIATKTLAEEQARVTKLQEQVSGERASREKSERYAEDTKDTYRKLQKDMRLALADFTDTQNRLHDTKVDLQDAQRESKSKEIVINDLRAHNQELRAQNVRLENELERYKATVAKQKEDVALVSKLQSKLAEFESAEAVHGVSFAVRVGREVLGLELEQICGASEAQLSYGRGASDDYVGAGSGISAALQTKVVLDSVCGRLKALPEKINTLKTQVSRLHRQLKDYKQLIPMWNTDALEDLEDAYNADAAVHRQIYSMKDKRSFIGLGLGENVPPYLRTDGIVRHVFVSKAELEDFMQEFESYFFSMEEEKQINTEQMHIELHHHLQRRFEDPKALFEFSYAFICGLEAYRHDPDFELFDLMLCGALHPEITKDQREMLKALEQLIRACQEGAITDEVVKGNSTGKRNLPQASSSVREQVSRRVIRAALEAVFPEKTIARQDALRHALYVTVQMLSDAAKTPSPDCVYISDLFMLTADGSQTPFIEEIRRQHVYEVLSFTAELTKRLLAGRPLNNPATVTDTKSLRQVLETLDLRSGVQDLVAIGCPESGAQVHVSEVLRRLRQGALLRPQQLWVTADQKAVVKCLLAISNREATETEEEQGVSGDPMPNRRIRAGKVVHNPWQTMTSDQYSSSENLEQAMRRVPQQAQRRQDGRLLSVCAESSEKP